MTDHPASLFTAAPDERDPFDAILDPITQRGDLPASRPAKPDTSPRHPCQHCGGSGQYKGVRLHQPESRCFACDGRGYFKTSAADRQHNRQKAADRKRTKAAEDAAFFDETNAGLRDFLKAAALWSDFAASLHAALGKYGDLTPAQLLAAQRMRAKAEERDTARAEQKATAAAEAAAAAPTLDRLAAAFLTSSKNLQWPKLRIQTPDGLRIVLSRAGAASRNAGSINITDGRPYGENTFYGTITPEGRPTYRNAPEAIRATLERFNANPAAEIKAQGLLTGECCVCGRTLTDPDSIANGIGAVCAANWGF